jgi:hypothetical protein
LRIGAGFGRHEDHRIVRRAQRLGLPSATQPRARSRSQGVTQKFLPFTNVELDGMIARLHLGVRDLALAARLQIEQEGFFTADE